MTTSLALAACLGLLPAATGACGGGSAGGPGGDHDGEVAPSGPALMTKDQMDRLQRVIASVVTTTTSTP